MIRAILNALRAGLTMAFRAGLWAVNFTLSIPGAVVRGLLGGGAGGPAPMPQPEEASDSWQAAHGASMQPSASAASPSRPVDQGRIVWHYARAAVAGGRSLPESDLDSLAPEVRGWVERLSDEDMQRIADAGASRTAGHVNGKGKIRGVPRVGAVIPSSRASHGHGTDMDLEEDHDHDPRFDGMPMLA